MRPILASVALVVVLAAPAVAQVLPETSRSELQSTASSNALVRQGQSRDAAQQNQFEINALRTDSSRSVTAPPVAAPPIAGPAPIRR